MPRNVEIKAKIFNVDRIKELARELSGADPEVLFQEDTFYKVNCGRLKLRNFQGGQTSQLVFYNRPDAEGPKLSDYSLCPVPNPEQLDATLTAALGQIGTVTKRRTLFIYQQTRIHIDHVDGLGDFMELEVVLTEEQTLEQGQEIAKELMNKLEVREEHLISGAYLDQK